MGQITTQSQFASCCCEAKAGLWLAGDTYKKIIAIFTRKLAFTYGINFESEAKLKINDRYLVEKWNMPNI